MQIQEYDGETWVKVAGNRGVYVLAMVCTVILAAAILAAGWGY